MNQFEGFSPLITNEIVNRRQFMTSSTLPEAFDEVMAETKLPPTPIFHKNHETGKEDFYFIKLNQFNDDTVTYDSLNDLLDRFMMRVANVNALNNDANDLVRFVQQQLHKYQNKLAKLIEEYEQSKNKDTEQLYGELITANIYRIKQGDKEVTALNYTNEEVVIPLNPTKCNQQMLNIIINNIIV